MDSAFTRQNNIPPSSTFAFSCTFDQIEELAEVAREWNIDFWQLEAGKFRGELFQSGSECFQVCHTRFTRKLKQSGAPPRHLRTFAVPVHPLVTLCFRGHSVTSNSLMIYPVGSDLEAISESNFEVYVFSISEDYLEIGAEVLGFSSFDTLLQGDEVRNCSESRMNALRSALQQVCLQVRQYPELLTKTSFLKTIKFDLPRQVLLTLAEGQSTPKDIWPPRKLRALRGAEVLIAEHASHGISLSEICSQLNVSEWTLRNAFRDRYGISPKAYLNAYRLNQVHKALRKANPKLVSVRSIADQWGFWHAGQFAKDYKTMFGEKPSETLKSSTKLKY